MTSGALLPSLHSIWLMPSAEDEAFLSRVVEELAEAFGTPVFLPHLTLESDVLIAEPDLRRAVDAIGRDQRAVVSPVARIDVSEAYFRSFYARFAAEDGLFDLKRRSIAAVRRAETDGERLGAFMPHVSLLYGSIDPEAKAEARRLWTDRLAGRPIRFDTVAAVRSANDIPIADWTILRTIRLM
jgi:hypothetical protein